MGQSPRRHAQRQGLGQSPRTDTTNGCGGGGGQLARGLGESASSRGEVLSGLGPESILVGYANFIYAVDSAFILTPVRDESKRR